MQNSGESINRYTVAFQLNEALQAIAFTLQEIEHGKDTDPAIWVFLGDILNHLCLAWHRRRFGPDEVAQESREEYERRSVSVPNWGGRFRLVEFTASHAAVAPHLPRRKIDRSTAGKYLREAEVTLQNLVGKIEAGQLDVCDTSTLADNFEPVLCNLCLAWHLRYSSGEEISSLDPSAINELRSWMPPWQWNIHLIPAREEPTDRSEIDATPK